MSFVQHPPPRYGGCDSFFVQSDDDMYSVAERNRERSRAIARVQHRQLGHELSKLTSFEYQEDILDHMEYMETETMPDVNSIDIQTEIQWYMRPYLLDFLIEAHAAFGLLPDTFFLAVNLLDRYCSRRVVYKRHYQLVGCAALLIAAKYGDKKDKVPTVRELRQMCCQLYDEDMFLQMEWHVLQTLNWIIGHPTIDSFLQLALQDTASENDLELQHMTWYICELALFHKEFVPTRPSVLARSALALARCILNRPTSRDINWAERYDSALVLSLANQLQQPSQVLFRKYSSMTFSAIAYTVESFLHAQQQQQQSIAEQSPVATEPKYDAPTAGTPQTPQKHQYNAAIMQHGCWTPPETPDNDRFAQPSYSKPHFPTQAALPPTPSPTHSSHSVSSTMSGRYQYQTYFPPQNVQ